MRRFPSNLQGLKMSVTRPTRDFLFSQRSSVMVEERSLLEVARSGFSQRCGYTTSSCDLTDGFSKAKGNVCVGYKPPNQ